MAGKTTRRIDYLTETGDPYLLIEPKYPDALRRAMANNKKFAIRLEDAWSYAPEKNPRFDVFLPAIVTEIFDLFFPVELVTKRDLKEIEDNILRGIEELHHTPPLPDASRVIGEITIFEDGAKVASKDMISTKPNFSLLE